MTHPTEPQRPQEQQPRQGTAGAVDTRAQAPVGWLPQGADELFGAGANAEEAYDLLTVDVPATDWIGALETARDRLGCTYFDWLSAVDEPGVGFRVAAHVVALGGDRATGDAPAAGGSTPRRLLIRTTVPHDAPALPTATGVYAGAAWHERETHEMFGIDFPGHPHLLPLLLPDGFEGHPLRKDFVLAARVAKAWPGAKEPGESDHGGPKRRQMLPPGVPDPNEWGPLKGTLPPAPARAARGARAAAAGDRPPRRMRTASAGSAGRRDDQGGAAPAASERPARRTRSASEGSASRRQRPEGEAPAATPPAEARPARRMRSASEGSASQREAGEAAPPERPAAPMRSTDAPWHHPHPALDDTTPQQAEPGGEPEPSRDADETKPGGEPRPGGGTRSEPEGEPRPAAGAEPAPEPDDEPRPGSRPDTEPDTEPDSRPRDENRGSERQTPGNEGGETA